MIGKIQLEQMLKIQCQRNFLIIRREMALCWKGVEVLEGRDDGATGREGRTGRRELPRGGRRGGEGANSGSWAARWGTKTKVELLPRFNIDSWQRFLGARPKSKIPR